MELAKKLRDIMRSYNVEKQRLSWELQVNVLQTQMKTIDQAFKASMITAGGAMLSGVLTIGIRGCRRGNRSYSGSSRRTHRWGSHGPGGPV